MPLIFTLHENKNSMFLSLNATNVHECYRSCKQASIHSQKHSISYAVVRFNESLINYSGVQITKECGSKDRISFSPNISGLERVLLGI